MKEEFEGRLRMQEEEIPRLSRSLSSSVHVNISDSGSVEEMNQKALQNWVQNPNGVLMLIGRI